MLLDPAHWEGVGSSVPRRKPGSTQGLGFASQALSILGRAAVPQCYGGVDLTSEPVLGLLCRIHWVLIKVKNTSRCALEQPCLQGRKSQDCSGMNLESCRQNAVLNTSSWEVQGMSLRVNSAWEVPESLQPGVRAELCCGCVNLSHEHQALSEVF